MVKIKRKINRKTSRAKTEKKSFWNFLSGIKFTPHPTSPDRSPCRNLRRSAGKVVGAGFTESYTSLILGVIVVLVLGILFITFAKGNRIMQTSSVSDVSNSEEQKSNTTSTYTVNPGDNLWSISENLYKDGYKWIEIAKVNELENPGLIYAGNKLIIPTVAPTIVQKESVAQNSIIQNNSIMGNTYTVIKDDNLWDIAVRAYGDGFKWPEIAKVNNLENPSLIFSGNVLKIPR